MRWTFAALLAAGGLITVLCLGWRVPPTAPERAAGDSSWQVRELAFLKAAHDRMQQERFQQDNEGETEGAASLRREQQLVVRQMAETATLLPREAVPAELRVLLQGVALPPIPAPLRPGSAAAESGVPELRTGQRIGFAGGPGPAVQSSDVTITSELLELIRAEPIQVGPVRVGPAAEPSSRRKPRETSDRPAAEASRR